MIRSYYFFDVESFCEQKRTKQQMVLGDTGNADPVTEIIKIEDNFFCGLTRLQLIHENKDKTPRRMPGNMDFVEESIVGGRTPYNLYWDKPNGILIARAPKTIINGAMRRLKVDFPKEFRIKKHEINFAGIIDRTRSTVLGAWFGFEGRIKKVGLFGDRVNLDESFDRYQHTGSMTALYIEIEFNDNHSSTIMLTKDGGVILYEEWDIAKDLAFLTEVIRPLFYEATNNEIKAASAVGL